MYVCACVCVCVCMCVLFFDGGIKFTTFNKKLVFNFSSAGFHFFI